MTFGGPNAWTQNLNSDPKLAVCTVSAGTPQTAIFDQDVVVKRIYIQLWTPPVNADTYIQIQGIVVLGCYCPAGSFNSLETRACHKVPAGQTIKGFCDGAGASSIWLLEYVYV